jgi:ABC-2 type transport system ATP-binding protein
MIEVQEVTKSYAGVPAVRGVSFRVAPGEVVGFLGPNGAGKSTILKMISTWHAPDEGRVTVAGFDTQKSGLEVRRRMGYLAEHNALWETMSVRAFLDFVGRMHGLDHERLAERRGWVVSRCELESVLEKRIAACSKGFRQRIGVAAALIHDPEVLVLDEPTHGLDPLQVVAFRDFIREIAKTPGAEKAVLFSSHILSEVAAISDRVLVIQDGVLVLDDSTAALLARAKSEGTDLESLVLGRVVAAKSEASA